MYAYTKHTGAIDPTYCVQQPFSISAKESEILHCRRSHYIGLQGLKTCNN